MRSEQEIETAISLLKESMKALQNTETQKNQITGVLRGLEWALEKDSVEARKMVRSLPMVMDAIEKQKAFARSARN